MQKKRNLLLFGDSPVAHTGLGKLHKILLKNLYDTGKYEIFVLGINHHDNIMNRNGIYPVYDKKEYPYKIYADKWISQNHPQGTPGVMKELISNLKIDIVITSHDYNTILPMVNNLIDAKFSQGTKWINYIPLDRISVVDQEANLFTMADANIFITQFARDIIEKRVTVESAKKKMFQIYHPLDIDNFEVVGKNKKYKLRKEYTSVGKDFYTKNDIVIGNINKIFHRKDPARFFEILGQLSSQNEHIKSYWHGQINEFFNIGTLLSLIENTYKELDKPFRPDTPNYLRFPLDTRIKGEDYTPQDISNIYNMFDIFLTTSMGEGFGYTTVEAMYMGLPIVAPNNTSFTELLGDDRGYLIGCDEVACMYGHHETIRQRINTKESIETISNIIESGEYINSERGKNARQWVIDNLRESIIMKQWNDILKNL